MVSHPQNYQAIKGSLSDEDEQIFSKIVYNHKKKQRTQKIQNPELDLRQYKPHIGLIHSIWFSKSNKKMASNIGTAFQISNNLILTCRHNIYSSMLSSYAQTVEFLPQNSIEQNQKPIEDNIIKARIPQICFQSFIKKDISELSFEIEPIIEEFCVLELQKTVEKSQSSLFPTIGNLSRMEFNPKEDKLAVIGYPNTYFSSRNFRDSQTFKQEQFIGEEFRAELRSKQSHVFHYTMKTTIGMSGSPIFAIKENDVRVVGIHTHRGKSMPGKPFQQPGYNSGLYFNEQIFKTLQSYLKYYEEQVFCRDIKKKGKKINFSVQKQNVLEVKKEEFEQAKIQVQQLVKEEQYDKQRVSKSKLYSDQSQLNRSVFSVDFLQDESFQNTSQFSDSAYEWIESCKIDLPLNKISLQSCSEDEFEEQSWPTAVQTDSTDTSFLNCFEQINYKYQSIIITSTHNDSSNQLFGVYLNTRSIIFNQHSNETRLQNIKVMSIQERQFSFKIQSYYHIQIMNILQLFQLP